MEEQMNQSPTVIRRSGSQPEATEVNFSEEPLKTTEKELKDEIKKSVEVTPDTQGIQYTDEPKKTDEDLYGELVSQYIDDPNKTRDVINTDKVLYGVSMSKLDDLNSYEMRNIIENRNDLDNVFRDLTSDYYTITSAKEYLTPNMDNASKSLEKLGEEGITHLHRSVGGLGDAPASVFKKYRDQKEISLKGSEGLMAFTSLTGGVRRVRLYNSGFYLSFRNIPIINLHQFSQEFNNADYEFGKEFGAFYYMFSDLYVRKYIIEHLLPLALCGSNYGNWRDQERLLNAISVQDFDAIMWTLGVMMHPNGIDVGFVCGDKDCGHVERQHADLSKLRLNNTELINDDMLNIMKKSGWLYDEDLVEYRNKSNFNRAIEFEYDLGGSVRKWKIHLKQASLRDWIEVGDDYVAELRRRCDPKKIADVNMYMLYNSYRALKPWISRMELTVQDPETKEDKIFAVDNDGDEENNQTIFMLMDEFQANAPEFGQLVEEYITDTKVTHICFYMPKCPKCGKEPVTGYKGYLPYDPMRSFFILARTKLLQGGSRRAGTNTSRDTKNS